ncbi:4a-hydroxytetrahydrobiopterin dehydratase [Candidatus Pacearchaeota archaeon]|nr:4a-hydroxytetrahydrobiopterin dehydratase [Candidatus Pacearchaeota archaeon]
MLNLKKIQDAMSELDNWSLEPDSISKNFQFNNFKESLEFLNKVGEIAEKLNHHPDVIINYNVVKLSLSTHSEKGLTEKDFETAKEIDKL